MNYKTVRLGEMRVYERTEMQPDDSAIVTIYESPEPLENGPTSADFSEERVVVRFHVLPGANTYVSDALYAAYDRVAAIAESKATLAEARAGLRKSVSRRRATAGVR
jgi:hypothetical protein